MRIPIIGSTLACLAGLAGPLSAQATPVVATGDTVRLSFKGKDVWRCGLRACFQSGPRGTVVRISAETLFVAPDRGGLTESWWAAPDRRVSVLRGHRSRAGQVAAWSSVAGAGGAAFGALSGALFCGLCTDAEKSETVQNGALGFGIGFAVIGFIFGAVHPTERWEEVRPTGLPVQPVVAPSGRGVLFGLSVALPRSRLESNRR